MAPRRAFKTGDQTQVHTAPAPKFGSAIEARVHERLQRLVGASAAAFFADTCLMRTGDFQFQAKSHLLGHLTREVESALRQTLVAIPEIAALLPQKKSKSGHRDQVVAILTFFELRDDPKALAWEGFTQEDSGWHRVAHRDDLRPPRKVDDRFYERCDDFLDVLDAVLDGVERKYAGTMSTLESIKRLAQPTDRDLKFVVKHVGSGTITEAIFFSDLSAGWLPLLRENRFFETCPDPIHDDDGVRFPYWPPATYLAAVAAAAPEAVTDIILKIGPPENPWVHGEFLAAALTMVEAAPDYAAQIAECEAAWIARQDRLDYLIPDRLQHLAAALIRAGRPDAGGALARAALTFLPSPDSDWTPRMKLSSWAYGEAVTKIFSALADVDAAECCRTLMGLLTTGAAAVRWGRAAVEDHAQNRQQDDALDALLVMLRDVAVRRAAAGVDELNAVVSEFDAAGVPLLRRVALHVLATSEHTTSAMIAARLTDQSSLDDFEIFHELAVLAQLGWRRLTVADRASVIEAFREHARASAVRRRDKTDDRELDDIEVTRIRRRYLRQWFAIIADHLDEDLRREYDSIITEFGGVEQPTFHAYLTSDLGDDAPPRSAAELAALSDEDLRAFLSTWEPPARAFFLPPSRASLATELQASANENPSRFVRAELLDGLHPQYVCAVVQAAEASVASDSRNLEQGAILDLVDWVVSNGGAAPPVERGDDEPDAQGSAVDDWWTSAHRAALELATKAIPRIPSDDEPAVARTWGVIAGLLMHRDPSAARVAAQKRGMLSINCVRGAAVHAAIALGLHIRERRDSPVLLEIEESLIRMSDPGNEPSVAVRHAGAHDFNNILVLSPRTASAAAVHLFPTGDTDSEERRAAWRIFLNWNPASAEGFELLRESYRVAIARLPISSAEDAKALGIHIIRLALYGVLPLTDDGIAARFVELAPVKARQHAVEHIGRELHRAGALEPLLVEQLKQLWTWWRAQAARTTDRSDLAAFGWWFTGKALPVEWLLTELGNALRDSGGALDWEHAVAERLAGLAPDYPREVAGLLETFLQGGDGWRFARAQKGVRAALEALRHTSEADSAPATASRLVSRGQVQFRDLAT